MPARLSDVQICMVGDRLDTDILFGKNGGLTTMLCLSGERCRAANATCLLLSLEAGTAFLLVCGQRVVLMLLCAHLALQA